MIDPYRGLSSFNRPAPPTEDTLSQEDPGYRQPNTPQSAEDERLQNERMLGELLSMMDSSKPLYAENQSRQADANKLFGLAMGATAPLGNAGLQRTFAEAVSARLLEKTGTFAPRNMRTGPGLITAEEASTIPMREQTILDHLLELGKGERGAVGNKPSAEKPPAISAFANHPLNPARATQVASQVVKPLEHDGLSIPTTHNELPVDIDESITHSESGKSNISKLVNGRIKVNPKMINEFVKRQGIEKVRSGELSKPGYDYYLPPEVKDAQSLLQWSLEHESEHNRLPYAADILDRKGAWEGPQPQEEPTADAMDAAVADQGFTPQPRMNAHVKAFEKAFPTGRGPTGLRTAKDIPTPEPKPKFTQLQLFEQLINGKNQPEPAYKQGKLWSQEEVPLNPEEVALPDDAARPWVNPKQQKLPLHQNWVAEKSDNKIEPMLLQPERLNPENKMFKPNPKTTHADVNNPATENDWDYLNTLSSKAAKEWIGQRDLIPAVDPRTKGQKWQDANTFKWTMKKEAEKEAADKSKSITQQHEYEGGEDWESKRQATLQKLEEIYTGQSGVVASKMKTEEGFVPKSLWPFIKSLNIGEFKGGEKVSPRFLLTGTAYNKYNESPVPANRKGMTPAEWKFNTPRSTNEAKKIVSDARAERQPAYDQAGAEEATATFEDMYQKEYGEPAIPTSVDMTTGKEFVLPPDEMGPPAPEVPRGVPTPPVVGPTYTGSTKAPPAFAGNQDPYSAGYQRWQGLEDDTTTHQAWDPTKIPADQSFIWKGDLETRFGNDETQRNEIAGWNPDDPADFDELFNKAEELGVSPESLIELGEMWRKGENPQGWGNLGVGPDVLDRGEMGLQASGKKVTVDGRDIDLAQYYGVERDLEANANRAAEAYQGQNQITTTYKDGEPKTGNFGFGHQTSPEPFYKIDGPDTKIGIGPDWFSGYGEEPPAPGKLTGKPFSVYDPLNPKNLGANPTNKKEIFVFGSNTQGRHGAGAAKEALQKHGAKYGQAEGLQGNSYGIVTKDLTKGSKSIPLDQIQTQLSKLYQHAKSNPQNVYNLTAVGTGLAGYKVGDLKSILQNLGPMPKNIKPLF
jgi:hypothetical protein